MSKKIIFPLLLSLAAVAGNIYSAPAETKESATTAKEVAAEEIQDLKAEQISLLSEAFGHMLAQHIQSLGIKFDVEQLVKGLQDETQGKASPMEEAKCIEALTQARQQSFLRLSKKNLQDAEKFLAETAQKPGIHTLEQNKLYYQIEREGQGPAVTLDNSPLIRYTGTFIDGKVFGASKEDDVVVLSETIPGFSRGLIGMKEGEKRKIYIHPDLAYGTSGALPPNSLLVFEIELVKAHMEEESSSHITASPSDSSSEKEISQNPTNKEATALR